MTNADWLSSPPAAQILPGLLRERVVVVVLLGNPTGLSWPNNRDSEIFLQLLPESVQRRS